MERRIFISYRRNDAAGDAGRLADHLHRRFGRSRVFLDIDTIAPGSDFVRVLDSSLQHTVAMLVVIGPRWLSSPRADGTRRLDDPDDFVRREVTTALGRDIPVVPVLVQGTALPAAGDLPEPLAALATRQAVALDHAEFHDDAERLCDRLAPLLDLPEAERTPALRGLAPAIAVAALLIVAAGVFAWLRTPGSPVSSEPSVSTTTTNPAVDALIAEAGAQRRRDQYADALATLARAREAAPASPEVQQLQEDVAMEWILEARVEAGTETFGEAIRPAVAVIDASLAQAEGTRRADLLAHSGWAAFLMWRDGNRRLDPAEWYREALTIDPVNPYANAMLAHWQIFRGDDITGATRLFAAALQAKRAIDAVRTLQWAAYGNSSSPAADVELVRLADSTRRAGVPITVGQAQRLWRPYYFAVPVSRTRERDVLLDSLPADDHIATIDWAFTDYTAGDESRRRTTRFYGALLHGKAGRQERAAAELRALQRELEPHPGPLQDAVAAAIGRLPSGSAPGNR